MYWNGKCNMVIVEDENANKEIHVSFDDFLQLPAVRYAIQVALEKHDLGHAPVIVSADAP
jgi:hypothetical protein